MDDPPRGVQAVDPPGVDRWPQTIFLTPFALLLVYFLPLEGAWRLGALICTPVLVYLWTVIGYDTPRKIWLRDGEVIVHDERREPQDRAYPLVELNRVKTGYIAKVGPSIWLIFSTGDVQVRPGRHTDALLRALGAEITRLGMRERVSPEAERYLYP